jgi:nicotinate-nucleotide adenylyltransferase
MKLGVFGGTFDPPHLGHLALASAARDQLKLDRVLWVVAGQSPLKLDRRLSPPELRAAMVLAAIAGQPLFVLSRVDLDRPGPHYTVDTLAILAREYRGAELYFIMGEDSLRDLPRWRDPQGIVARAWLAVLDRPGAEVDVRELESAIPGLAARVVWVQSPRLAIASSEVRHRVAAGQPVRGMLPAGVWEIIEREGLYK